MRKLLVIFALIAAASGCTHLTAPEPGPTGAPGNMTSYFWPDSNAMYSYQSNIDGHVITVSKGGIIVDQDKNSDSSTTLNASLASGSVSLTGLSSADLLGLDQSLNLVSDTNASTSAQQININSIAAVGNTLYVASNNFIYKYWPQGDSLQQIGTSPSPTVRLYSGSGVGPGSQQLYAVEIGGNRIWSTPTGSINWASPQINWGSPQVMSGNISAFAAEIGGGSNVQYWVACGNQLYRYSNNNLIPISPDFSNPITAIETDADGQYDILVGLSSGAVFEVASNNYQPDSLGFLPAVNGGPNPSVTAIANNYIGSSQGLYGGSLGPHGFQYLNLRQGSIGSMLGWVDGGSIGVYVGLSSDSVYAYSSSLFGSAEFDFKYAVPYPVTQFAPGVLRQFFAVVNSQLYTYDSAGWVLRGQSSANGAKWSPGGFTMLKDNDTGWLAGYVESFATNNLRGYFYWASLVLPDENVQLDGIEYSHVISVRYTAYYTTASGAKVPDMTDAPSYLIYYQLGKGPIRIERSEDGTTVITRLSQ